MKTHILTSLELLSMRYPARKRNILTPVINLSDEEWRQVIDYVSVSNLGRVKKLYQAKQGQTIERLYKLQVYNGHLYTQFAESINRKYRKVARIVLMAFKPQDDYKGKYALFVDCNPLNCHIDNLRWASLEEIHVYLGIIIWVTVNLEQNTSYQLLGLTVKRVIEQGTYHQNK